MSAKPDHPENPQGNAGSLLSRITAAGIVDGVMSRLEAGDSLASIVESCARHGITTSPPAVWSMKRRHLSEWQSARVMEDAEKEGLTGPDLLATVQNVLLSRLGRFAVACQTLEQLRLLIPLHSDVVRATVAQKAENRQERDSIRRFAMRVDDLLADDDKLAAVRAARAGAAVHGTEARLKAIVQTMWGDFGLGGEEAA